MTNSRFTEYFDLPDAKIEFLHSLNENGHEDEALLLSCAYLDGMATLLYYTRPDQTHRNFVRILCEYGGDIRLSQIHPLQLLMELKNRKRAWSARIVSDTDRLLRKAIGGLYTEAEILDLLSPEISTEDKKQVKNHLWRGTLASLIFTRVRCELVHCISPSISPHTIDLSLTQYDGKPVGKLGFSFLVPSLRAVASDLRRVSEETDQFLGHNFKKQPAT